jgi:hypothetical protein
MTSADAVGFRSRVHVLALGDELEFQGGWTLKPGKELCGGLEALKEKRIKSI